MTSWEALFLGIIQGLTEFLPISSSGHLELAQHILGFSDLHQYVLFDLICHLGTLCAIVLVLFPHIKQCLSGHSKRVLQITLATLPLIPLVLILKPLKAIFNEPEYLGICFLVSSLLLFMGEYIRFSTQRKAYWYDALTIGCVQAIAVLPGISRSGSTISAARTLGWSKEEAFTFSFLLAIPAILGATALEIIQFTYNPISAHISIFSFVLGFVSSFFVGYFSLKILIRMLADNQWIYFAWYCLGLGILTTWWFNFSSYSA